MLGEQCSNLILYTGLSDYYECVLVLGFVFFFKKFYLRIVYSGLYL